MLGQREYFLGCPIYKMPLRTTHLPMANPGLNFIFSWACRFDSDLSLGAELRVQVSDSEYYFPVL